MDLCANKQNPGGSNTRDSPALSLLVYTHTYTLTHTRGRILQCEPRPATHACACSELGEVSAVSLFIFPFLYSALISSQVVQQYSIVYRKRLTVYSKSMGAGYIVPSPKDHLFQTFSVYRGDETISFSICPSVCVCVSVCLSLSCLYISI